MSSDPLSCPQCRRLLPGRAATSPSPAQVARKEPGYNGISIAALVLGLIDTLPSVIAGLLAILLGIAGLAQLKAQARKQEPVQKGRWMAITGIVLEIGETVVASRMEDCGSNPRHHAFCPTNLRSRSSTDVSTEGLEHVAYRMSRGFGFASRNLHWWSIPFV